MFIRLEKMRLEACAVFVSSHTYIASLNRTNRRKAPISLCAFPPNGFVEGFNGHKFERTKNK